jgi:hypothetical protein
MKFVASLFLSGKSPTFILLNILILNYLLDKQHYKPQSLRSTNIMQCQIK